MTFPFLSKAVNHYCKVVRLFRAVNVRCCRTVCKTTVYVVSRIFHRKSRRRTSIEKSGSREPSAECEGGGGGGDDAFSVG